MGINSRSWRAAATGLVIAGCIILAWSNRFVQDDAFISFRYAKNLIEGDGLVFNRGEYLEGYTNFLWTLLIALGMRLGGEPIAVSYILGMLFFSGSLVLLRQTAEAVTGSFLLSLVTVAIAALNFTFSAYATGGLETSLQTFLLLAALRLLLTGRSGRTILAESPRAQIIFSILLALGLLTRMDAALFALALAAFALYSIRRSRTLRLADASRLIVPFAVIVGAWFCWKLWYYGEILPNSYYAKVVDRISTDRFPLGLPKTVEAYLDEFGGGLPKHGMFFLETFILSYHLTIPILLFLVLSVPAFLRAGTERRLPGALLLSLLFLWTSYCVKVGGDFMEFRFLVPIIPVAVLYSLWALSQFPKIMRLTGALLLALWLPVGSFLHMQNFTGAATGIESIGSLNSHPRDLRWEEIGETMYARFGGSDVTVASLPLGVVSYLSGLTTIDMLGITDRYIARETKPDPIARFGHQRTPTISYLRERKVNLIIGEPWFASSEELPGIADNAKRVSLFLYHGINKQLVQPAIFAREFREGARFVAIPTTRANDFLICLYLTPHALIDRLIEENNWQIFTIVSVNPNV